MGAALDLQCLSFGTTRGARFMTAANNLIIRNRAMSVLGYRDIETARRELCEVTGTVTFLAGAGSRWVKSVEEAQLRGLALDIDPGKPRCMAPVMDLLDPQNKIPIGTYNLRAMEGLGKHYIVYSSDLPELQAIARTSLSSGTVFLEQSWRGFDSPLGHGDAMMQLLDSSSWDPSLKFVITNFGGDVNSRETIFTSLLVLAALQKLGEDVHPWGLLPTVFLNDAAYPVILNDEGFPVGFGHNKLTTDTTSRAAQCNIGVRLYTTESLRSVVDEFQTMFDASAGYKIPGNKGNEFALDNVDMHLADNRRLRTLNIATPHEIGSSAKTYEDLDRFLAAMKMMLGI